MGGFHFLDINSFIKRFRTRRISNHKTIRCLPCLNRRGYTKTVQWFSTGRKQVENVRKKNQSGDHEIQIDEVPHRLQSLEVIRPDEALPKSNKQRIATKVVSQNVQTLSNDKLEILAAVMKRQEIDVALLQETKRPPRDIEIKGYRVFLHGKNDREGRSGVGIMLSPKAKRAW